VIQFLPEIHYSIDFETVSGVNPCGGGGNLESTAPSVRRVDLVDIRITGTYSDNSVQTQTTQAVYAIFDNGTVARLGFFSHPLYDPAINGGNFEVNTGGTGFPISLSIPTTDLISLSFDPRIESFGALDGDLTPTYQSGDTLTCLDRQAMAGLVGVSIGDATYTPRADFDVDGVIDSDDYAAFCALHWAATPCRADFNCSGSVTVQDVFDHQGAYFNGSLEADFDCTGTLSVQDLFDFLDAYFTGCQ
jgi:hypothetical protein